MKYLAKYLLNILIWLDQGLNTILLFGDPDETISSRAGKYARNNNSWAAVLLCKLLHLVDKNHCTKSIEEDEGSRSIF